MDDGLVFFIALFFGLLAIFGPVIFATIFSAIEVFGG